MRYAYADPPYLGCSSFGAAHHYGPYHPNAADYDDPETHRALILRLCEGGFDGWALSLHTPSLRVILPMCPDDVRVMAWVKPFCSYKPNVNPAYAWEPVIVWGGRKRDRWEPKVRDWVAANINIQRPIPGSKPPAFCRWIFAAMGMQPGDELVDMFPGTNAVSAMWDAWSAQHGGGQEALILESETHV